MTVKIATLLLGLSLGFGLSQAQTTDKAVKMEDHDRATIAVIQRDLNGMQARMAQIGAEYNTLKAQVEEKAKELNAAMDKAKRDGCEIDTEKLEYKCH